MSKPQNHLEGIVHTRSEEMEDFQGPLDVIFLLLSKNKIGKVSILPPQGKDLPKIRFRNVDGAHIAYIDYTKRTLACVRAYYGEPDVDHWGKPPAVH